MVLWQRRSVRRRSLSWLMRRMPRCNRASDSRASTLVAAPHDFDAGLRLLRTALEEPPEADFQQRFTWFLGQLAEGLGRAGQIAEGLGSIDQALARSERNEDRWCVAELLRIKGELLLLQDATGAAAAEDQFRQALDWAHRQGALSWELRTASSLARLWRDQYRVGEVRALLSSVYGRFTESFATGDLRQAKSLLEQLA
jgi:predicted ATPase